MVVVSRMTWKCHVRF